MVLAGAHSRELDTLKFLRKQLPDDDTVILGVQWTREYASGTSVGEIDFVVVNRSGDVLFIERKDGELEEPGNAQRPARWIHQ
jgi:hypothetical protein